MWDFLQTGLQELKRYLTLWVVLGAVGFALALLAITLIVVGVTRPAPASKGMATAVIYAIPAPTDTPLIPTSSPVNTPTPTSQVPPPPSSGSVSVGSYVQVTGTGNDGLRLRADPGLQGDTRFLGMDSEVFQVADGPREADGYTWWYLIAPYDQARRGWAVSNYLVVIQNP
jgi:hypothetical protein